MKNTSISSRFVSVHSRQIFVQEKSLENPVTILFIHGRCLSVRSWERQFESEVLTSFGLIAFDLPGHGSSEHVSDLYEYSLEGFVQLLTALIEELKLTNFIIVGHSLGGHIGLQALPKLVGCRGIFCMTMPLTKPANFEQMYCQGELLMTVYKANPDSVHLDAYVYSLFQPQTRELPYFIGDDFRRTDPAVHEGILQGLLSGSYQDEADSIRDSNVPVAIVQGALEQVHNLAYLNSLNLTIWRNKPQLVPQAGHMVQWENSEYVNELINAFLSEIK